MTRLGKQIANLLGWMKERIKPLLTTLGVGLGVVVVLFGWIEKVRYVLCRERGDRQAMTVTSQYCRSLVVDVMRVPRFYCP